MRVVDIFEVRVEREVADSELHVPSAKAKLIKDDLRIHINADLWRDGGRVDITQHTRALQQS
jgi:hypothetical protein